MITYHTLHAVNASIQVSLHPPDQRPEGMSSGSEAICMIDNRHTVLVQPVTGRLNTPGGPPRDDESSEATMIRAVREQACDEVVSWHRIAFARSEVTEDDHAGQVMDRDMYVARVALLPWQTLDDRIAERQIVQLDDLAQIMSADWPGLDAFSAELVALAKDGLASI